MFMFMFMFMLMLSHAIPYAKHPLEIPPYPVSCVACHSNSSVEPPQSSAKSVAALECVRIVAAPANVRAIKTQVNTNEASLRMLRVSK